MMLDLILMVVQYGVLALGASFLALETLWMIARRYAMDKTTALGEIPRLGSTRKSGPISGTAVTIGGSIAGLATAIVCSKFFEQIVIIEPDSMAESRRPRVAQAEQIHAIQAISLPILRKVVPDFDNRSSAFGGRILESNGHAQLGTINLSYPPHGLPDTVFISRLSLERLLRAYIPEIPNIRVIQGVVTRAVPGIDGRRIDKVTIQPKDDGSPAVELETALLVDCSGPSTVGLKLLEKCRVEGWGPYPKLSYDPKFNYATVEVPVADRLQKTLPIFTRNVSEYSTFDKLGFLKGVVPNPEQSDQAACAIHCDDNSLTCGLGVWGPLPDPRPQTFGEYVQLFDSIWEAASNGAPSKNDPNRQAIMDSLRAIDEALTKDKVVPEFKFCKMGPCYKIDYSQAARPSNFVAIGDSFLRVNPIFGQGVSKVLVDVASLNGALLDTKLFAPGEANLPDTFSDEMIARQYPRVTHMWDSSKNADYGRRNTEPIVHESLDLGAFGRDYWRGILCVARQDKQVAARIMKSLQLVAPPLDLLRPSLFARAMWHVFMKTPT